MKFPSNSTTMDANMAIFDLHQQTETSDVVDAHSVDLSDTCARIVYCSDHQGIEKTDQSYGGPVEGHLRCCDGLIKTDHWLQQPRSTMNSKLTETSTPVSKHGPVGSDTVVDTSSKNQLKSSPQERITYVHYRTQSSVEFSFSNTLRNVTSSTISKVEIHENKTTSTISQDEILENITTLTISQDQILETITTAAMPQDEIPENIATSTISQEEILENITTLTIPQDDTLRQPLSADIVPESALTEQFSCEQPACLMKSFTEQLSITCELQLDSQFDEVCVDGVNDDNREEHSAQMSGLSHIENQATNLSDFQNNYRAELLVRGQLEQNPAPGRGTPVTPYTRGSTVDQVAQPSGSSCLHSFQGQRFSRPEKQGVPRTLQPSLGPRIPLMLRSVPNSHNQFYLQVVPQATYSNPLPNSSDIPGVCSSSRRPKGNINSSLECASGTPTSSASVFISGTERQLLNTKPLHPLEEDGPTHYQNHPTQAMHDSIQKHSQIGVKTNIEKGLNWSDPHLLQAQQHNLITMNSRVQQYNVPAYNTFHSQHKMLDSKLYMQACSDDWTHRYLPDFSTLTSGHDTEQPTPRQHTASIEQRIGRHQKQLQLIDAQRNTPSIEQRIGRHQKQLQLIDAQRNTPSIEQRIGRHQKQLQLIDAQRNTPNVEHRIGCHQKHQPPLVDAPCNTPDRCCYVKDTSHNIPRELQLDPTNQHSYSVNSIPRVETPPANGRAPTAMYSIQVDTQKNRQIQPGGVENHCPVQHLHSMHGQCHHPVNHAVTSKRNACARQRTDESYVQQSHTGKHDAFVYSPAGVIPEGRVTGKTRVCHRSTEAPKPQPQHTKVRMDKVNTWLSDKNNVSIGADVRLYDSNNHNTCTEQDNILQASQSDEQTARQTEVLTEHSNQPRGLFDGRLLSDSQQIKQTVIKKNSLQKETAQKGNTKYGNPEKEIQKNKTQVVNRNCTYKSSIQLQHLNNITYNSGCTSEFPTNGCFTDRTIDKIRQKQLPKYKHSVTPDCRFSQADIEKADAAIDEEIKLLDEQSLKESMVEFSTSSDRDNVLGEQIFYVSPNRTNSPKAISDSNRKKAVMPQTEEKCKNSYRQFSCDPVCATSTDTERRVMTATQKENDVLTCRGGHQLQTNSESMHVIENTSPTGLKQISNQYSDAVADTFTTDVLNFETPEPNFLYQYITHDQQRAVRDGMLVYTKEAKYPEDLDDIPCDSSNQQTIRSVKHHYKITANETSLSTSRNHQSPPDYVNTYPDNAALEHINGPPFIVASHRTHTPIPVSIHTSVHSSQSQQHRYETECFHAPNLPNKGAEHRTSSYNTANFVIASSQNSHNKIMPHNFQNIQRPGLAYAARAYEGQPGSSSQSKINQHSVLVSSSSQATSVTSSPPSRPGTASPAQRLEETLFKIPHSVVHRPHGSNLHYNETFQTEPSFPSISADSDVSMNSDKSLSRSHLNNISVTDNRQQTDFASKVTPHPCHELQYQELQTYLRQLQNHNPQLQLVNQNHKDAQQEDQLRLCLQPHAKQAVSYDRHGYQSHGSKGGTPLPYFLQSADCDDNVMLSCSITKKISQQLLNKFPCHQNAQSLQPEVLDSMMTSISEKSQMSTGTSDDSYNEGTQSSGQQAHDTANATTQQGYNNTANFSLNQTPQNSSKTVSSLQSPSGSSSSRVTTGDTNLQSSTGSHFGETTQEVFPLLDFEDCRDAMPLSPCSSADIKPIHTVTKPDQVLIKGGRLSECAATSDHTLRICKHKSEKPTPYMSRGVGTSSSACDGDSQVSVHRPRDPTVKETEMLSDMSFLSGLQEALSGEDKNEEIRDILKNLTN